MVKYIVRDMASVFRFLPYGLLVGIIAAVILSAINDRRVRKNKSPFSVAAITCFFMYVVIMLFITFLSRESGSRSGIDLELLSTWGINKRNNAFVIENVLLFIPYGFLCAWMFTAARKFFSCTLICMLTSLGIECMQLMTGRGFFQIDDVLTNTMGGVIGYILFRCFLNEEKTGREKTKWVYRVLAVLMMAVTMLCVFAFSSESASESNNMSMNAARYVVDKISRWLNVSLDGQGLTAVLAFVHPLLRKLAHASEYAALAVVIGFGYQLMKKKRAKVVNYFYAVFLCSIIAIVDEMLQKYVFFRTGRLMDVAIDVLGALAGGCIYIFLSELFEFLLKEE